MRPPYSHTSGKDLEIPSKTAFGIGKILIVDDQKTHRTKIALGVTQIGHEVCTVSNAADAKFHLQQHPVDLVLLDIEMPEADGFSVLEWRNQQPQLKHVPIVVISAHESDSASVVKAIKLGAVDFLPKNFALPILSARINAGLRKKRNRDSEIEQAQQIEHLTRASELLEQAVYNPKQLRLTEIAVGSSPMAGFAAVFSEMAQKIYDRERRLKHQADSIKGLGLLLLSGLLFGLDAPVAKWFSQFELNAIGLAIWINVIVVLITIPRAIVKKEIPKLDWYLIGYFLLWGFCTCILGDVVLLIAAEHIPASIVTIIIVTEVLMVYAYIIIRKIENTNLKKMLGVVLGFLGVSIVVLAQNSTTGGTSAWWAFVALGVPLGYAIIDLMIALARKINIGPSTTLGLASVAGLAIMIPMAWQQNGFVAAHTLTSSAVIGIFLWAVLTWGGMLVYVQLIRTAGPVFGSQTAYVQTIAGIGLSFIFLGESLSPTVWLALVVIVVGMLLVEPKREPEEQLSAEDLAILMNKAGEVSGIKQ